MTELVGASSYYDAISYTVVTNIVSGTDYNFRIRAQNKWGLGDWSDTVTIEASTNPLTDPTAPTTSNSGANVLIQWPLPNTKGSDILEYDLIILA